MDKQASGLCIRRYPDLFGLAAVQGRGVSGPFDRHVHAAWCLGAVTRGTRSVAFGQETHLVRAGGLFAIPPGEPHRCSGPDPGGHDYLVLCLGSRDLVRAAGLKEDGREPRLPVAIADPGLFRILERLFTALEAGELSRARGLVRDFAAGLLARHAIPAPSNPARPRPEIEQARKLLDARADEPRPLAEMAREAAMCPHHFHRLFTAQVGVPPHAYATQARVKAALDLIRSGADIALAAAEAGFADQSHLGRHFKRNVGVTPGVFKRDNAPQTPKTDKP